MYLCRMRKEVEWAGADLELFFFWARMRILVDRRKSWSFVRQVEPNGENISTVKEPEAQRDASEMKLKTNAGVHWSIFVEELTAMVCAARKVALLVAGWF